MKNLNTEEDNVRKPKALNSKRIMDYFPLPTARPGQVKMLNAVETALRSGKRNIIIEAPVGAGKSAINVAIARWGYKGGSHMLTPKVALQDQYVEDFGDMVYPMKGASRYPCTYAETKFGDFTVSCGVDAICKNVRTPALIKEICLGSAERPLQIPLCPYKRAIQEANHSDSILHNFHSFLFQSMPNVGYFDKRDFLIIDEAHNIESVMVGMVKLNLTLPEELYQRYDSNRVHYDKQESLEPLYNLAVSFTSLYSDVVRGDAVRGKSPQMEYKALLERMNFLIDILPRFTVTFDMDEDAVKNGYGGVPSRTMTITPLNIAKAANRKLFDMANFRIFSSGTIFSHKMFCNILGLKENDTTYLRMASDFPIANRPVILPSKFMVNTSARTWGDNVEKLSNSVLQILRTHPGEKGLIHAGSYKEAFELAVLLGRTTKRILTHNKDNFAEVLAAFYASDKPMVLISPICIEGIDMKYDRGRFQIITKVPYPSLGDPYTSKVKDLIPGWYDYNTMIRFGQMLGRVVRAGDDTGVTYVLDSRINGFLNNTTYLLKGKEWMTSAIFRRPEL